MDLGFESNEAARAGGGSICRGRSYRRLLHLVVLRCTSHGEKVGRDDGAIWWVIARILYSTEE